MQYIILLIALDIMVQCYIAYLMTLIAQGTTIQYRDEIDKFYNYMGELGKSFHETNYALGDYPTLNDLKDVNRKLKYTLRKKGML